MIMSAANKLIESRKSENSGDCRFHKRILSRQYAPETAEQQQGTNVSGVDNNEFLGSLRSIGLAISAVRGASPSSSFGGNVGTADCEEHRWEAAMSPHPDRCPTHPGELLREDVIPATGVSKAKLACLLGITRSRLSDILAERKPITPSVAVRLGKLCGNGAQLWVDMQCEHDIWHAKREVDLSVLPTLKAVA